MTSNFSWRWVFVAEVVIALSIAALSGRISDVEVEETPRLDLVGAALSATGLALVIFGVLQSSSWGWVTPRVRDGENATPALGGISATTWLIAIGAVVLWGLLQWLDHRKASNAEPLFDPDLLQEPAATQWID